MATMLRSLWIAAFSWGAMAFAQTPMPNRLSSELFSFVYPGGFTPPREADQLVQVDMAADDGKPWDELVLSWEADTPGNTALEFLFVEGDQTLSLGRWSSKSRTSVNNQNTNGIRVFTDTLVLPKGMSRTGAKVKVRMIPDGSQWPTLYRVHMNLSAWLPEQAGYGEVPLISPLNVPMRAQAKYPNGGVLCSPTSVSMILAYWAQELKRPELDRDVPLVQTGVFDPGWNGTGNWPFNTAYAAALPGMTGYVTRLRDIEDLLAWLRAGVPVACSVSYDLLKGKGKKGENDGHLVVAVGTDAEGNIVFNDPGRNVVRYTYKTEDFLKAWGSSRNTVYLIYPERWIEPQLEDGPWRAR